MHWWGVPHDEYKKQLVCPRKHAFTANLLHCNLLLFQWKAIMDIGKQRYTTILVFGQEFNAESSEKQLAKIAVYVVCVSGRLKDKFVVCQFNRKAFGYRYKKTWKLKPDGYCNTP